MTKQERYQQLLDAVANCKQCPLHKTAKHKIAGYGSLDADLFMIGEAPGVAEDNTGVPFASPDIVAKSQCMQCSKFAQCYSNFIYHKNIITKCEPDTNGSYEHNQSYLNYISNAGGLLDKMLGDVNLTRDNVYITNTVACRPVDKNGKNRKPTNQEIEACSGRLKWLIDIIQPKGIVFIGSVSTNISKVKYKKLKEIVGKVFLFQFPVNGKIMTYPAVIIYHPASLLYKPSSYNEYYQANVDGLRALLATIYENKEIWKVN